MNDPKMDFVYRMPKVELHAHLNGSLSSTTIRFLAQLRKTKYPERTEVILPHDLHFPQENNSKSFCQVFELFKIIQGITDFPEAIYEATKRTLAEFSDENVKYIELRSTPKEIPGMMSREEYVENVFRAMREVNADENLDIVAKYQMSIDRRLGVEVAWKTVELNRKYRQLYPDLCADIELSGDARKGVLQDFLPVFKEVKNQGWNLSFHLAEVSNHEETEMVLREICPHRIGHGTFIHPKTGGSENLWKLLKQLKIPLELCLTSNVSVKSVSNYQSHHLKYLHEEKMPFAICTDDKGVFFASLSDEYSKAKDILKLSDQQMFEMSLRSIDHIFASDELKSQLKLKWNQFLTENSEK